jgi:Tfp pilus assembly protein PilV
MNDHVILGAMLVFSMILTAFVGYLTYRAHRASQQIEGLTAATFLEVRKVLTGRPDR